MAFVSDLPCAKPSWVKEWPRTTHVMLRTRMPWRQEMSAWFCVVSSNFRPVLRTEKLSNSLLGRPGTFVGMVVWICTLHSLTRVWCGEGGRGKVSLPHCWSRINNINDNGRARQCHPNAYDLPFHKTTYRQKSFFPRTITEWNAFPASVAMAPILGSCQARVISCVLFFFFSPPATYRSAALVFNLMKLAASTNEEEKNSNNKVILW